MKTPWEFVNYLAQRFSLNNCESADLSSWAEWLTIFDKDAVERTEEDVRAQLFMRAEVLRLCGSQHQEMYDALERASGRKWGYGELMA